MPPVHAHSGAACGPAAPPAAAMTRSESGARHHLQALRVLHPQHAVGARVQQQASRAVGRQPLHAVHRRRAGAARPGIGSGGGVTGRGVWQSEALQAARGARRPVGGAGGTPHSFAVWRPAGRVDAHLRPSLRSHAYESRMTRRGAPGGTVSSGLSSGLAGGRGAAARLLSGRPPHLWQRRGASSRGRGPQQ
jgi:hypothetical protein